MSLILNGTNGVSDVDGSASTPAVRGTDTNTGIFFPAADTIAFAEGGAEVARFDSNGNFGIGVTADSSNKLQVTGDIGLTWATDKFIGMKFGSGGSYKMGMMLNSTARECRVWSQSSDSDDKVTFYTGSTPSERIRINTSGNMLIGKTASNSLATIGVELQQNGTTFITKTHADGGGAGLYVNRLNVNGATVLFYKDTTEVGNIAVTGSATSYNSGSDYRLKNDIQPLTNALQRVALLKPSTWTWKADDTYGDGFIAHELAEVCPNAVTGEKDAVNEDGSIRPQGVDTSFLVATLTAAIQEQQAIITEQSLALNELKTRIEALEQA